MLNNYELIGNKCFDNDKEFSGTPIGNSVPMRDPEECHSKCIDEPDCKFFSFRNGKDCLLITTKGNVNKNVGVVSGARENCQNVRKSGIIINHTSI